MWKMSKVNTIVYLIDLIGVTDMIDKIKKAISGKKLYITAGLAFVTALVSWSSDAITTTQFVEATFAAVGMIFLRVGVQKSGPAK